MSGLGRCRGVLERKLRNLELIDELCTSCVTQQHPRLLTKLPPYPALHLEGNISYVLGFPNSCLDSVDCIRGQISPQNGTTVKCNWVFTDAKLEVTPLRRASLIGHS